MQSGSHFIFYPSSPQIKWFTIWRRHVRGRILRGFIVLFLVYAAKTEPCLKKNTLLSLIRKIAKSDYQILHVCLSIRISSVPMEHLGSNMTLILEIRFWGFFEELSRKFKFHQYMTWITVKSREQLRTFMILPRSVLLRMRNISYRRCRENQNTFYMQ